MRTANPISMVPATRSRHHHSGTRPMNQISSLLASLGVDLRAHSGTDIASRSPIDGATLAVLRAHQPAEVAAAIGAAQHAFQVWRAMPAPMPGVLRRAFADEL